MAAGFQNKQPIGLVTKADEAIFIGFDSHYILFIASGFLVLEKN